MAWSYDPTALAASPRDAVRFLVGDTDTNDQKVQDEEITYVLSKYADDPESAAPDVAERIAAKYAGKANKTVGPISKEYSGIADQYRDLARRLRRARSGEAIPAAGGLGPTYLAGKRDDYSTSPANITSGEDTRTADTPLLTGTEVNASGDSTTSKGLRSDEPSGNLSDNRPDDE